MKLREEAANQTLKPESAIVNPIELEICNSAIASRIRQKTKNTLFFLYRLNLLGSMKNPDNINLVQFNIINDYDSVKAIILTKENFQEIVLAEYDVLEKPTGMIRRKGAEDGAGIWAAMGRLDGIYELLKEGRIDKKKATTDITDAILELASSLYAAGAEHELWRHWISLTCFGMYLSGEIHQAAQYAAIAGEWDFIQVLPPSPVTSQQLFEKVIWELVRGQPTPNFSDRLSNQIDAEDRAWLTLRESIPNQDNANTEAALKTIAEFWMAELEDWMNYVPDNYPDFHPQVIAAAAIARHHGFTSTSFTAEQYSFLEAGLAISKPLPMFPKIFSLPPSFKS